MDERIDFSTLDPDRDPSAEARFLSSVMARVGSLPEETGILVAVWSMVRPAVAAAVVIVALGYLSGRRQSAPRPPETVADAIGIPPAAWASAPLSDQAPR